MAYSQPEVEHYMHQFLRHHHPHLYEMHDAFEQEHAPPDGLGVPEAEPEHAPPHPLHMPPVEGGHEEDEGGDGLRM
jgi:hypothetical protein